MSVEALSEAFVGLVFVICGLASARGGARVRVIALLMSATGLAWWAGFLGDPALFLYRGLLVHLILSYPTGRLAGRFARVVTGAAYALAFLAPLNRNDVVAITFPLIVLAASGHTFVTARGPVRRGRRTAFVAAAVTMGVLALGTAVRLRDPALESTVAWGFDLAMVLAALLLAADLRWGRWSQASLAGLALDLGVLRGSQPVVDKLAKTLGDPQLRMFYWLPDRNGYVDEQGHAVVLPAAGPGRAVTMLEHQGRRVAAMVHDPATADDPELVESAATLAWLALANVQMQAEVQTRVSELDASRRRIVDAVDAERRRLDAQLEDGAQRHLSKVADLLAAGALADVAVSEQLSGAQSALHEFAVGMYPRSLTHQGLGPALEELVRGYPIPVDLHANVADVPITVAAAAYFVCAEALSNVGKYAKADRVRVDVTTEAGVLVVRVVDEGVGSANIAGGSGLSGLRDRVEALGGTLSIDSPAGRGTKVQAVIPTA
jgi:signal transduction histidine kinase